MRNTVLTMLIAVLGLTVMAQAEVTFSGSSGQGDASYTIPMSDPGDPGDPPPGDLPPGDLPPDDGFGPMALEYQTVHQTITMPTAPFGWWAASANAPLDSNVHALASMFASFETLAFSGGAYSGCQADTAEAMAIASTDVSFYFTLDVAHSYVLSCTTERSNDMQYTEMTIHDAAMNMVASNLLNSGNGPQVVNATGTLAAGTYRFHAMTTANYGGGEQSAEVDYTMSFTEVPEPATMALLGLGGLAMLRRRVH